MAGQCVFCRRELKGIAAEEHIFPQWLLKHVGIPRTDQMFQGVGMSATLDVGQTEGRVHATWRFVEGRVCEVCNHGWLDTLERETRPGLEALIAGAGRIVALTPSQRRLLSRWAAKTAFLIANVSPFNRPVPPGHLWALNNGGEVPASVAIYAGQSGTTTKTAYIQSTQWHQFTPARNGYVVGAMQDAYKIGLQVQDLLLLAAFSPKGGVQFVTAAGVHCSSEPGTANLALLSGPNSRRAATATLDVHSLLGGNRDVNGHRDVRRTTSRPRGPRVSTASPYRRTSS